jgi:hypothetical protein
MRRRIIFFVALLSVSLVFLNLPAARASEVSHARIVRLSYAQGTVQFREAATPDDSTQAGGTTTPDWQKALVNTPMREGMTLATGDGRAEVEFESGDLAWISSNTVLDFPQLALAEGTKLNGLAVRQGTASFYLKADKHDSFVIQAGGAQIRVPGAARFRVDVFGDGTSITALRGTVEVEAGDKIQRVDSKTTLSFRSDSPESFQVGPRPALDGWDHWVSSRSDSVDVARFNSAGYLDTGLGYGIADLSFYGSWMMLPGYGYAWQPWGMAPGWSPFFSGYWSSFGLFGPTWISYEPWGWLPYHYGGWVYAPYGWMWVPGNSAMWSPATVTWLVTPVGMGWVPVAPGDSPGHSPANLAHGVVTNTPTGMATQLPNSMLAASSMSKVRVVGAWQNDPELARLSNQAQVAVRTQAAAGPRQAVAGASSSTWRPGPAERMPAGPAPRISRAAFYQGTVTVYHAPAMITPTPARAAQAGGYSDGRSPSGGSHSAPAPSAGPSNAGPRGGGTTSGSAGGSRGGGGGSGKP